MENKKGGNKRNNILVTFLGYYMAEYSGILVVNYRMEEVKTIFKMLFV